MELTVHQCDQIGRIIAHWATFRSDLAFFEGQNFVPLSRLLQINFQTSADCSIELSPPSALKGVTLKDWGRSYKTLSANKATEAAFTLLRFTQ